MAAQISRSTDFGTTGKDKKMVVEEVERVHVANLDEDKHDAGRVNSPVSS